MLKNLRGFSNTKLAGVLIAIIIVPFVFWGMGSVFSGGNTNNLAKINNKPISTQDFIEHVNQSRINIEYVKKNLENNVIEEIFSFKKKYPNIARNKICNEIIKLVLATVVLYIAITYPQKPNDKITPAKNPGNPDK